MSNPKSVSAAALAVAGTLLAGCASAHSPASASSPTSSGHSPYVLLTSGSYKGIDWRLFAWQQQGHLCMELDPAGTDPDHRPAASSAGGAGACQFDHSDPSSGYYASGPGPAGSAVSFGPLPDDATQIRVATHETLATASLPTGKGLPTGRYWINIMPAGWPTQTEGSALPTPQPLDANGGKVAFQSF